ncbi:NAD(P)/FAD-dependent oxidoreductase [Mycobacterium kansasii]
MGASAAGVTAALELRTLGFEGSIALFDRDDFQPYERPPLSKCLGASSEELIVPIASEQRYQDAAIDLQLGVGVAGLRVSDRELLIGDRWHRFDRILLATGARPRRLPAATHDAANVHTLRTAADALALSSALHTGERLVIVGGGFIGLEVASAAAAAGMSVTIVEASKGVCQSAVGLSVGTRLQALHTDKGISILTGAQVVGMTGHPLVHTVALSNGQLLPADTVVVAVGAEPNIELFEGCGISAARGVKVDQATSTGIPGVFAAGDVAAQSARRNHSSGGRIEHWTEATAHGATAARAMLDLPADHETVPFVWSNQYDQLFQMFGRPTADSELIVSPGVEQHCFRAFWVRRHTLVAAAALDSRPVLAGARRLIEAQTTIDVKSLNDPRVTLREVAKRAARSQRTAPVSRAS